MPDTDFSVLKAIADKDGSLAQRVYLSLRDAILSLDIAPGAALHKAAICDRLGVSRAPVSEAIARLSFDDLVNVVPQSGSHVAYLDMEKIRESAFLREALELAAIDAVTPAITSNDLRNIKRNLRLQEVLLADGDTTGFYEADEVFHDLLMHLTGFRSLSETVHTASLKLRRARVLILPSPGRMAKTMQEHHAIYAALQSGDATAARAAMQHHLRRLLPEIAKLEASQPHLFGKAPDLSEQSA